jgi:hypothetical protein
LGLGGPVLRPTQPSQPPPGYIAAGRPGSSNDGQAAQMGGHGQPGSSNDVAMGPQQPNHPPPGYSSWGGSGESSWDWAAETWTAGSWGDSSWHQSSYGGRSQAVFPEEDFSIPYKYNKGGIGAREKRAMLRNSQQEMARMRALQEELAAALAETMRSELTVQQAEMHQQASLAEERAQIQEQQAEACAELQSAMEQEQLRWQEHLSTRGQAFTQACKDSAELEMMAAISNREAAEAELGLVEMKAAAMHEEQQQAEAARSAARTLAATQAEERARAANLARSQILLTPPQTTRPVFRGTTRPHAPDVAMGQAMQQAQQNFIPPACKGTGLAPVPKVAAVPQTSNNWLGQSLSWLTAPQGAQPPPLPMPKQLQALCPIGPHVSLTGATPKGMAGPPVQMDMQQVNFPGLNGPMFPKAGLHLTDVGNQLLTALYQHDWTDAPASPGMASQFAQPVALQNAPAAPAEPKPKPAGPTSPAASSSASAEDYDVWNVKHQDFHDN